MKVSKENIQKEFIKNQLLNNKGYLSSTGVLKKGYAFIASKFDCTQVLIKEIVQELRQQFKYEPVNVEDIKTVNVINKSKTNMLIIGDLHAPWILEGYLEWCKELEKEYNCNKVVFIGDVIDSGAWSFHEHDVDGMSVGDELTASIKQLKLAYELFPTADVTLGNHDLLVARKARAAGLSQRFIKDFGEIIEAPKSWIFRHEFIYDNVRYIHGSVGNAFTRAKESRMSTVQGHLHSQSFLQYSVSEKDAIFGLQIGCGVDREAYAFDYAKPMPKKPVISAGVVLNNGELPILRLMKL